MFLDKEVLCTPSSNKRKSAIVLTILIVVTFCACCVQAGDANGDNSILFTRMRKRVGHFSNYGPDSPYGSIYEEYFKNVIQKNDIAMENIDSNDWRNVRPSGDTCIEFLIGFQVTEYILIKPFDIIPLDSCLDWLFDESDEKKLDMDRLPSSQREEVKELQQDPKFKELFENTHYKDQTLPQDLIDKVYDYITKLLKINSDNPKNGCHSLWLQAYIDFIEKVYLGDCDDEEDCMFYDHAKAPGDSYLKLIAESSKEASKSCYAVMQTQMKGLIEQEYDSSKSVPTSLAMKFQTRSNRVARQSEKEKWSREMIGVLQLAAGSDQDKPINLGDVVRALDRIKNGDADTIERFTNELGQYALNNVDIKDSSNDPTGRNRYGKAMAKLCRPYIDQARFLPQGGGSPLDDEEDNRKPFEFYNLIYSLVRITNHEPTFHITKEKLEDDIVANHWESLYLATFACQIISTTWGTLNWGTNTGSFSVKMRPKSQILIVDWPIEIMNQKLPTIYKSSEKESPSTKISYELPEDLGLLPKAGSSSSTFGRKFKGIFSKSDKPQKKSKIGSIFHREQQEKSKSPPQQVVARPPAPAPKVQPPPPAPVVEQQPPPPQPRPAPMPQAVTPVERAPVYGPSFTESQQSFGPTAPANTGHRISPESLRMWRELKGYKPKSLSPNNEEKDYYHSQSAGSYPMKFNMGPREPERPASVKAPAFSSAPRFEPEIPEPTRRPAKLSFSSPNKVAVTTKSPANSWASVSI